MLEILVEQTDLEESHATDVSGQTNTNSARTSTVFNRSQEQQCSERPATPAPAAETLVLGPAGFIQLGNASAASQHVNGRPVPTTRNSQAPTAKIKYLSQVQLDAEEERLRTLSQAAMSGDKTAIDRLRVAFDNCPHIWRRLADLQHMIETKMATVLAEQNPLMLEAFRKRCSELRQQVVGDSEMMLVKLAASRVIASWTFAQFVELRALDESSPWMSKYLQQAERRLEAAMRTFALAKRLEQQLAVAAD